MWEKCDVMESTGSELSWGLFDEQLACTCLQSFVYITVGIDEPGFTSCLWGGPGAARELLAVLFSAFSVLAGGELCRKLAFFSILALCAPVFLLKRSRSEAPPYCLPSPTPAAHQ